MSTAHEPPLVPGKARQLFETANISGYVMLRVSIISYLYCMSIMYAMMCVFASVCVCVCDVCVCVLLFVHQCFYRRINLVQLDDACHYRRYML